MEVYEIYPTDKINIIKKNVTIKTNVILVVINSSDTNYFKSTINSFVNCCLDSYLISKWVCIGCTFDVKEISDIYPFFEFLYTSESLLISTLNLMVDYCCNMDLDKNTYIVYLSDALWTFTVCDNYITKAISEMEKDNFVGQVLFNKYFFNHALPVANNINKEIVNKFIKHNFKPYNTTNNSHWPHFALKPSIIKSSVFKDVGYFNNSFGNFEYVYGLEYIKHNYSSIFFNNICTVPKLMINNESSFLYEGYKEIPCTAIDPPNIDGYTFIPGKDIYGIVFAETPTFTDISNFIKNANPKLVSTSGRYSLYNEKCIVMYIPNINFQYKTGIYKRLEPLSYYNFITNNTLYSDVDIFNMMKNCFKDEKYSVSLRLCKLLIDKNDYLSTHHITELLNFREMVYSIMIKSLKDCCLYKQPKSLIGIAHDLICDYVYDSYFINYKDAKSTIKDITLNFILYNDFYPYWEVLILKQGMVINKNGAMKIIQNNMSFKDVIDSKSFNVYTA